MATNSELDLLRLALSDPAAAREQYAASSAPDPGDLYTDPGYADPSAGLPSEATAGRAPVVSRISQTEADAIQGLSTGSLPAYSLPGARELALAQAPPAQAPATPESALNREPMTAGDLVRGVESQLGTSGYRERSSSLDPESRAGRASARGEDVALVGAGGAPTAGADQPDQFRLDLIRRLNEKQRARGRSRAPGPSGWSDMSRTVPGYQRGESELAQAEGLDRDIARQRELQQFEAVEARPAIRQAAYEAEQEKVAATEGENAARARRISEMREIENDWRSAVGEINESTPAEMYFDKRGTGARLATAFALFVAGFGGRGSAMQLWDRVQRDIDADLANQRGGAQGKRQLWEAARQRFATEEEQAAAVREGVYARVAADLDKKVDEIQDPARRMQAEEFAAQAHQQALEAAALRRQQNAGQVAQQHVWDTKAVKAQEAERRAEEVTLREEAEDTERRERASEEAPMMTDEAIEGHFEKLAEGGAESKAGLVSTVRGSAGASKKAKAKGISPAQLSELSTDQLLSLLDPKERAGALKTQQDILESKGMTRDMWVPSLGAYAPSPDIAKEMKEKNYATGKVVGLVDQALALGADSRKFGRNKKLIQSLLNQVTVAFGKKEGLGALDQGTLDIMKGIVGDPTALTDFHSMNTLRNFRSQAARSISDYSRQMGLFSGPPPRGVMGVGPSRPSSFRPE